VRRSLGALFIAAIGAGLGWVAYWTQPPRWVIRAGCSGGISTVPGVSPPGCVPPPAALITLDPVSAIWWSLGGALLVLGLAAAGWWLAVELRDRRRTP
jgi:hypothetical protein